MSPQLWVAGLRIEKEAIAARLGFVLKEIGVFSHPNSPIQLIHSGMGPARVLNTLPQFLSRMTKNQLVISIGTAGSIHSELQPRTVIQARRVRLLSQVPDQSKDFDCSPLDYLAYTMIPLLLTCEAPILDFDQGRKLAIENSGAMAVDMESATIASLASVNHSFAVVRVISDNADNLAEAEFQSNFGACMDQLATSLRELIR